MIRKATIKDLDVITQLEATCFPPLEAASKESFAWRLQSYPTHFFVEELDGKIVAFINGPITQEKDLIDEMYSNHTFCNEEGDWQMIFGVATHPDYQHKGFASRLITFFIQQTRVNKKKGVVLTCKEEKISFYEKFGFIDEGVSISNHGGVAWHQMRITF